MQYLLYDSQTGPILKSTVQLWMKYRLRNDLYCVEWGVKLYSLTLNEITAKGFQFIYPIN